MMMDGADQGILAVPGETPLASIRHLSRPTRLSSAILSQELMQSLEFPDLPTSENIKSDK
jgi:hypothetical protein